MLGLNKYVPYNSSLKSGNYNKSRGYGVIFEGREGPLNRLQMSLNFTRCNILVQRNFLEGETLQLKKKKIMGRPKHYYIKPYYHYGITALRHYGITALRHYGITALRHYGITALRHYGITALRHYGITALRHYGITALRHYGITALRHYHYHLPTLLLS